MTEDWHDFFSALAAVSATTFGILFATLQLSPGVWKRKPLKAAAAVLALVELFVPIGAALIALMPGDSWRVGYVVMGTIGLGSLGWYLRVYGEHVADEFDKKQMRLNVIPFAVFSSMVTFGLVPADWALNVVAALSVWLIFSGSTEAWWLLRDAHESGQSR